MVLGAHQLPAHDAKHRDEREKELHGVGQGHWRVFGAENVDDSECLRHIGFWGEGGHAWCPRPEEPLDVDASRYNNESRPTWSAVDNKQLLDLTPYMDQPLASGENPVVNNFGIFATSEGGTGAAGGVTLQARDIVFSAGAIVSTSTFGTGSAFASGAPPVFTLTNPPA